MKHTLFECIRVQRPVHDCFAYLRDFSTIAQWDPGVLSAEKLTPGPVHGREAGMPGTRYQLTFQLPGRSLLMHYEQTLVETNRRLVLTGHSLPFRQHHGNVGSLSAVDDIEFEALTPTQTEIRYRAELCIDSIPDALSPAVKPALNRMGRKVAKGIANALAPKAAPPTTPALSSTLKDRLILPSIAEFGHRGYRKMSDKSLSQRLDGKHIVLTGPTSGIGLAAACELARLGATLILLGRNPQRMAHCRQQILETSGAAADALHSYEVDLSSLAACSQVADTVLKNHPRLDTLINNAGALFTDRQESREGHEAALAINLLSPVLLCRTLSAAMDGNSRIINIVSGGMYLAGLRLHDMEYRQTPYNGSRAYAHAKRALFVAGQELNRTGNTPVYAMHPGWAATPGVEKSLPQFNRLLSRYLRDERMGADTAVWLASEPVLARSDALWLDRRPHPANVIPATKASTYQHQQLLEYLDHTLQPYC